MQSWTKQIRRDQREDPHKNEQNDQWIHLRPILILCQNPNQSRGDFRFFSQISGHLGAAPA